MTKVKSTKIFVLDTNVILHDHSCIYQFQDNDIVLPITVLEELDKFKKGNEQINFQAREFVRNLDKIVGDKLFNGGIKLGTDLGKLIIATGKPFSEEMKISFRDDIPDHRILSVADFYTKEDPQRLTIFVSKDINLRMKAKSLGIKAEDYENDKVKDFQIFEKSIAEIENIDDSLIDTIYNEGSLPVSKIKLKEKPYANNYYILKGTSSNVLVRYEHVSERLIRIEKKKAYGISPRNAEQTFSFNALLDPEIKLMSLTGKAGTGKTLLALAAALEQNETYGQILLARPLVALSDKDIGFLPGDAASKISPYMQPLFDNLSVIKNNYSNRSPEFMKIDEMLKTEHLLITPLAFIRGRSLSNVFFIVDEAQNLTPHEIKTIITRAGEGTKMVFTGDLHQIDTPYLDMKSNGLAYMTDKMHGQEIFSHVNLVKGERSYLAELASNLL